MKRLRRAELRELVQTRGPHCVSILMPTYPIGWEAQQNPIRLKNLLTQAEQRLVESGLRAPEARDLLTPARELLDDGMFWRRQQDGLAVFLRPGFVRYYRVPCRLEEFVSVGESFHVKPLVPLFTEDGRYYVLTVSLREMHLYEGTRSGLHRIDHGDLPHDLSAALRAIAPERQMQFHTQLPPSGPEVPRGAVYHGQGEWSDFLKPAYELAFRHLDPILQGYLRDGAPLVLAGVDYLVAMYREATSYPHIVDQAIEGSPELLSEAELHARARALIDPLLERQREQTSARCREHIAKGRGTGRIEQALPAAAAGRVEVLFADAGASIWGRFDPSNGQVVVHERPGPGDAELTNLATLHALITDARVWVVPRAQVPDGGPVAAMYRF